MADQRLDDLSGMLRNMAATPWLRQLLMLVGIAGAVALGTAAVLWSRGPDFRTLYSSLAPERASQVVDTLTTLNIPYRIEDTTGAIMVPAEKLNEARLKLAGSGLAQGDGSGLEMLEKDNGFAVSEFMESKKYQHALETELARTIESMRQVRKARVHLAIPRQTVFVRERKPASASIMLDVFPGAVIDQENARAIVNLVAASIPDLNAEQVTIVDQQGNLLSRNGPEDALDQGNRQFSYRQHVEKAYEDRIAQLLSPMIASGQVKVQVAADIDFSAVQESRESFNPDTRVVRSEQINESQRMEPAQQAGGVPGSLSNQPPQPAAPQTPAQLQAQANDRKGGVTGPATTADGKNVLNGNSTIVRNYEIERTLNHVDAPPGRIKNLSVAVVVDNRPQKDPKGRVIKPGPTAAELERLNTLVRDAIGFNETRGDRVSVIAADFRPAADELAAPEPNFWEEPWFADVLKQGLAGLAILFVAIGILRPGMKQLMNSAAPAVASGDATLDANGLPQLPAGLAGNQLALENLSGNGQLLGLAGPGSRQNASQLLEEKMNQVRSAVSDDPRKVAQLVKSWVTENAES